MRPLARPMIRTWMSWSMQRGPQLRREERVRGWARCTFGEGRWAGPERSAWVRQNLRYLHWVMTPLASPFWPNVTGPMAVARALVPITAWRTASRSLVAGLVSAARATCAED